MKFGNSWILILLTLTQWINTGRSDAQLASTDPDISDGPCRFPTVLALNTNILKYANPIHNYYIPLASKALYRGEFEILKNRAAKSEEEILSLKSRIRVLRGRSMLRFGMLGLTFFEKERSNYDYACLPSVPLYRSPKNLLAPFLNMTCIVGMGSPGKASAQSVGMIYFSVIWTDGIATTAWGCIKGVPSFHIMSTKKTLSAKQISLNEALLDSLGFNRSNYQYMIYD